MTWMTIAELPRSVLGIAFIFGVILPWALGVVVFMKTAWDIFIYKDGYDKVILK